MRLSFFLTFIISVFLVVTSAIADGHKTKNDDFVKKQSPYSVAETLDRFTAILKKKGVTVFARINHSAGAEKVGQKLRDTELVIFGNPKLGTPLMLSNQRIGIDLPMKALAWKDGKGQVWFGYANPSYLKNKYKINDKDDVFKKMTGALNKLSNAALKK